jgi:hypothetical protein
MMYHTHRHLSITPFECPYHISQPSLNDPSILVKIQCPVAKSEPAALLRHKKEDHGYVPKTRAPRGAMKTARKAAKLYKKRSRFATTAKLKPERAASILVNQEEETNPDLIVSPLLLLRQSEPLPQQAPNFTPTPIDRIPSTQRSTTSINSCSAPILSTSISSAQWSTPTNSWSSHYLSTVPCTGTQYAGYSQTQYATSSTAWNQTSGQSYAGPPTTLFTTALGGPSLLYSQPTAQYNAAPILTGAFSSETYVPPLELFALSGRPYMNNGHLLASSQASSSTSSPSSFALSLGPSPLPLVNLVSPENNFAPILYQQPQVFDMFAAPGSKVNQVDVGVNDWGHC